MHVVRGWCASGGRRMADCVCCNRYGNVVSDADRHRAPGGIDTTMYIPPGGHRRHHGPAYRSCSIYRTRLWRAGLLLASCRSIIFTDTARRRVAGAVVVVFIAEECRRCRAPLRRDRRFPLRPLAAVRRVDVVVAARRTRLLHRPALRLQSGRERRRFSGEVALAGRCCPQALRRCRLAELRAMPRRPRLRVIALEAFLRLLQRILHQAHKV